MCRGGREVKALDSKSNGVSRAGSNPVHDDSLFIYSSRLKIKELIKLKCPVTLGWALWRAPVIQLPWKPGLVGSLEFGSSV